MGRRGKLQGNAPVNGCQDLVKDLLFLNHEIKSLRRARIIAAIWLDWAKAEKRPNVDKWVKVVVLRKWLCRYRLYVRESFVEILL